MINLYNKDCLAAMKDMADNQYDLAVVDPPYGSPLKDKKNIGRTGGGWAKKYGTIIEEWDVAPSPDYFKELFRVSKDQIIWGGNYFDLPPNRHFIVWDKYIPEKFTMAMCEYAWSSLNKNAKIVKARPQNPDRIHPTQKPVKLYEWLLNNYAEEEYKILDTHLGSGSIALACHNLNLSLDGFEINEDYYKGATERLEKHKKQQQLF